MNLGALAIVLGVLGALGSVGALRGKRSGFMMLLVLCGIGSLAGAYQYATDEARDLPLFSAFLAAMGAALWSCRRTYANRATSPAESRQAHDI